MRTFFDKYFFEIDYFLRKALRRKHETSDKSSKNVATQRRNACSAGSLRSDRARAKPGHYVATERPFRSVITQRPSSSQARPLRSDRASVPLGCYVATELFRNVDRTLVHAFSSTIRCYLLKTVANPFHVSRHSKSSIKLYGKNRRKFVLYRKKP
ncbi:hypothetical protein F2Q68_00039124 [Brassica cretica]|uniref:Uncharacterized protein n=1 Tax=Brassica cretica TaxID=69181 RepID=A0A8S9MHJ3_BRACR|nr:hypothetical protein F2Q68_00039124 [Brassica cretica]